MKKTCILILCLGLLLIGAGQAFADTFSGSLYDESYWSVLSGVKSIDSGDYTRNYSGYGSMTNSGDWFSLDGSVTMGRVFGSSNVGYVETGVWHGAWSFYIELMSADNDRVVNFHIGSDFDTPSNPGADGYLRGYDMSGSTLVSSGYSGEPLGGAKFRLSWESGTANLYVSWPVFDEGVYVTHGDWQLFKTVSFSDVPYRVQVTSSSAGYGAVFVENISVSNESSSPLIPSADLASPYEATHFVRLEDIFFNIQNASGRYYDLFVDDVLIQDDFVVNDNDYTFPVDTGDSVWGDISAGEKSWRIVDSNNGEEFGSGVFSFYEGLVVTDVPNVIYEGDEPDITVSNDGFHRLQPVWAPVVEEWSFASSDMIPALGEVVDVGHYSSEFVIGPASPDGVYNGYVYTSSGDRHIPSNKPLYLYILGTTESGNQFNLALDYTFYDVTEYRPSIRFLSGQDEFTALSSAIQHLSYYYKEFEEYPVNTRVTVSSATYEDRVYTGVTDDEGYLYQDIELWPGTNTVTATAVGSSVYNTVYITFGFANYNPDDPVLDSEGNYGIPSPPAEPGPDAGIYERILYIISFIGWIIVSFVSVVINIFKSIAANFKAIYPWTKDMLSVLKSFIDWMPSPLPELLVGSMLLIVVKQLVFGR